MTASSAALSPDQYTVGWICVLAETEAVAARAMLDVRHGYISVPGGDSVQYYGGTMGRHNVVIGCVGEAGIAQASYVATNMTRTFKNIKIGLLCGIGGGNPSINHDIRLGDIVVGMPKDGHTGVVQYNAGRAMATEIIRKSSHSRPPQFLIRAVENRKTDIVEDPTAWQTYLDRVRDVWKTFSELDDTLHADGSVTPRPKSRGPRLHYGLVASGDLVVKAGSRRVELVNQIKDDVLCFEMEAAGLVNTFPCLVVRGISDYCDQYKNDGWHGYAASVAAAYCRYLLDIIQPVDVAEARTAAEVIQRSQ